MTARVRRSINCIFCFFFFNDWTILDTRLNFESVMLFRQFGSLSIHRQTTLQSLEPNKATDGWFGFSERKVRKCSKKCRTWTKCQWHQQQQSGSNCRRDNLPDRCIGPTGDLPSRCEGIGCRTDVAHRNNRVINERLMWRDTDNLPAGCRVVVYANGTRVRHVTLLTCS